MDVGQPSIDQLRLFVAVVDDGSFNRAARRLGRAISAISYGVANLEAQLGMSLFERGGARRPVLTGAGRALLAEARAVIDEADALVAKARSMRRGLEAELALAVDVMVPSDLLAGVLRDFQADFPTVTLRLHVEALGAVAALLLDRRADIGVGGPVIVDCPELDRRALGGVRLVPVAAPGHPLARVPGPQPGDGRRQLQLVLTDRSALTEGRDFSVESPRTWRLADLGAKHALLREGIGWGNMPWHLVRDDIKAGRLVQLKLPEIGTLDYRFHALWRREDAPGPAARWLLDALEARIGQGD